jgi:Secretion system C-terminal sorting domain/REJ domain
MKKMSTFFRSIILLIFVSFTQLAYNQAPNWIWNSPMAVIPTSVSGGGLSLYAMIDRPGYINYVVLSHGSTAPSGAQIVAGTGAILNDNIQIVATDYKSGYYSIELSTSLIAGTQYDIYFVATDNYPVANYYSNIVKLSPTLAGGSGLTYWNGNFEQWNDTIPMYYYNWYKNIPVQNASYSRGLGESGYGFKTIVTKYNTADNRILMMETNPYPFGFSSGASAKYHVSLRLKASRVKAFSVAFNSCAYYNDFSNGSGSSTTGALDTIKSLNWETYSADFTMTSANRFKARWNINKTASVANGDSIIIDNFYIKQAADAPLWWNGNPTISNITYNSFIVNARIDEPGIVYYVVVPHGAAAPTVSNVLNGKANGGASAIFNDTINARIGFNSYSKIVTGLSQSTNYDLYLVAQNKESSPTAQNAVTLLSTLTSTRPVAKAGGNIWATAAYLVQLDGTGSTGSGLTYSWTVPGAITDFSSLTASKPTFTAPTSGTDTVVYPIILVVYDGVNYSAPDTAKVHVVKDYPPIANAGGNKSVLPGTTNISFDGSASYDPNGRKVTYSWTIPSGITLINTDTAGIISFNAPATSVQKSFKFYLVVNDGKLNSTKDSAMLFIKPTAKAGGNIWAISGYNVQLDGTGSIGSNLTYNWTPPLGISLNNNTLSNPTFTAPSVTDSAIYKIALVVNDGTNNSLPDTVRIHVIQDYLPIANAGGNKSVLPGTTNISFDGSASYDPNGKKVTYSWTIPSGITLINTDTARIISFNAPATSVQKSFKFYLVVNDGKLNSTKDSAILFIKPTAKAGGNIWAISGYNVQLDGTGSIGSNLTYNWTPPLGISLNNNTLSNPTFTAPSVTDSAIYKIALVVNDGTNNSLPDTVRIHVIQDYLPIANAGGNKSVLPGTINISFDGSASYDPNGKKVIYSWTIPSGITLINTDTARIISFNAPATSVQKSFKFYLVVNDGKLNSTKDSAILFIKPTAKAGGNIWAISGYTVQLDGTGSIGSNLTYNWTPPLGISLNNNTISNPTFTAPSVTDSAIYKIALVVNDGTNNSLPDTVRIHVIQDYLPIANAGGNKSVLPGTINITLNGSASYDPNGKPITYSWTIPSGITVSNPNTASITFNAPATSAQKSFTFYLIVNDGKLNSTKDSAILFIKPTAKAGGNIWAISGYPVQLTGTGSVGSNLTYNWTPPLGISLNNNTLSNPTFTAPSVTDSAIYKIALVVNDGTNNSQPDTVKVHVIQDFIPIAKGGGNKSVLPGSSVNLDGSQSEDPNGKTLTYSWFSLSGLTLTNANSSIVSFTAPSPLVQTVYKFVLVVNDGKQNSLGDTVLVTVSALNVKPIANAGINQSVSAGVHVVLNGSLSSDPNGDAITYHWTPPTGINITNSDTVQISFTAPSPTHTTVYPFILVVNDGKLNSNPDTVLVTVSASISKPLADAGNDQTVNAGMQVILSGSLSSDLNGATLTYHWTVPAGISLRNSDSVQISFTAPSPLHTSVYPIVLVVNNGSLNSNPDTVKITVLGTVGIKSITIQDVVLYPNPVSSNLNIKLSDNWNLDATIRVINALGSVQLERKMSGSEDQLELGSLPSGIYFIEIKDGRNDVIRKFMKK